MAEAVLERRYRRLLLAYPREYREARGDELVATLLDLAEPSRRMPSLAEAADLFAGGLRRRFRLGAIAGLEAGLVLAAPFALAIAAGISAYAWWRVEPLGSAYAGGPALFGMFRTLGPIAYAAWLLAAVARSILKPGPGRFAVGAAIAVTLLVPIVAPLTTLDRPPLWVLTALTVFGVLALVGTSMAMGASAPTADERLAVPAGAVAVAVTASTVVLLWPPAGGGFDYYYQPTIARVGAVVAAGVATVALVAIVRLLRRRPAQEWLWATVLLGLPAGWLGPFDSTDLRLAAEAEVPHFGRLAQVLLATSVAGIAIARLLRGSVGRGSVAPGSVADGSVSGGSVARRSVARGAVVPGSLGRESMAPGSLVPGSLVPGSLVPGSLVPGSLVPGSLVSGSLVPGSLVSGSLVRGTEAGDNVEAAESSRIPLVQVGAATLGAAAGLGVFIGLGGLGWFGFVGMPLRVGLTALPGHVVATIAVLILAGALTLTAASLRAADAGTAGRRASSPRVGAIAARAAVAAMVAAWCVAAYDNSWTAGGWTDFGHTAMLIATLAFVPLSACLAAAAAALIVATARPVLAAHDVTAGPVLVAHDVTAGPNPRAVDVRRWAAVAAVIVSGGWLGYLTLPYVFSWGPVLLVLLACVAVLAVTGRRSSTAP